MTLTDKAHALLERYLHDVRQNAAQIDRAELDESLRDHIAFEARAYDQPLSRADLEVILEKLGEPESYRDDIAVLERSNVHAQRKHLAANAIALAALTLFVFAPTFLFWGQAQKGGLLDGVFAPFPQPGFVASSQLLIWMAGLQALTTAIAFTLLKLRIIEIDLPNRAVFTFGIGLSLTLAVIAFGISYL